MLWDKFNLQNLPKNYEFKNTELHEKIYIREGKYSKRILLSIFSIAIITSILFGALNIFNFNLNLIIASGVNLIVNIAMIIVILKKGVTKKILEYNYFIYFILMFIALILGGDFGYYAILYFILQFIFIATGVLAEIFVISAFFISSFMIIISLFFNNTITGYGYINHIEYVLPIILLFIYVFQEKSNSLNRELLREILFDRYTKLPNREVLLNTKLKSDMILCLVKIENFKSLLVDFGYDIANDIFTYSAERIKEIDTECNSFKMSGNEYAILIPLYDEFTEENLNDEVHKIIENMQLIPFKWRGMDIKLNYNIGASVMRLGEDTIKVGLSKSDIALRIAVKEKKVVVVYNESLHKVASPIDSIIKFTTIIDNKDELRLNIEYQPVYDVNGKNIIYYESFTRLITKDGSKKSIANYVDIAKSTGIYKDISLITLETAANFALNKKTDVSVNISIEDVADRDYMDKLNELHNKLKSKNLKIYLEISEKYKNESILLENIDKYNIILDNFNDLNLNIKDILNSKAKIIKIDSSIIKNGLDNGKFKTLLIGILELLKDKDKKIIAKCIDNEEIYELAKEIGVDNVQGYYFKEPTEEKNI